MKKLFFAGIIAVAAATLCSCNKTEINQLPEGYGTVSIKIRNDNLETKSVNKTSTETDIKKLEVISLFDDGTVEKYGIFYPSSTSEFTMDIKAGHRTLWVVANGPNIGMAKTIDDILAYEADLASYHMGYFGFCMIGSDEVNILPGVNNECEVELSHICSKITLKEIYNNLSPGLGDITLDYAMLVNVSSRRTLGGQAIDTSWYNKMGRADETPQESTHIIDGENYLASGPKVTFGAYTGTKTLTQRNYNRQAQTFYCYPNPTESDTTGFMQTYIPRQTRLVLAATIGGQQYFYPVTMPDLQPNQAYDVYLNICGVGSDDPDIPVLKGSAELTIGISKWENDDDIVENI